MTQGTLANRDLSELVGPALTGLEQAGVLVVATLGREVAALPVQVPTNARVESFIPFGALLPKADLFITNGGFGATQQALTAGVPVIIAGRDRGQAPGRSPRRPARSRRGPADLDANAGTDRRCRGSRPGQRQDQEQCRADR